VKAEDSLPAKKKANTWPMNKSPSISEKTEQNFVKRFTANYVFLLCGIVPVIILISVFPNPLCDEDTLMCFM
jgi:hypothetical protein